MSRQRLLLVALVLLLAMPAFAQKFTAAIRGTVTDPTDAATSGAKVTLLNEATGVSRTVTTNTSGAYSFPDLPVGSYRVEVESAGFKTAVQTKVVINVADVREVNVKLETGAVTETVSVEANPNAVKTVGAEISGLVSGDQVRELPLNGRNFLQLTLLQPGVTADENLNTRDKGLAGGANISVSGGSITSNLWLVDGADNVDHGSNRTILVYPSVDAIEEFKIQRNNYGAEFGGAGGGQINLVTRGGTNTLHGTAYYYVASGRPQLEELLPGAGRAADGTPALGRLRGDPGRSRGQGQAALLPLVREERRQAQHRALGIRSDARRARRRLQRADLAGCTPPKPIDPLTGQRFPNDRIPQNRLSTGGQLLMGLMSEPEHDTEPAAATTGCRPSRRRSTGTSCTPASTGASRTARA